MGGQLMYLVVRKIGGISEKELLGEGNIDLVRKIEVRDNLLPHMTIEVWGGSRFRQSYKGTISYGRNGLPIWESSKKSGWTYITEKRYIKPSGKLGEIAQ